MKELEKDKWYELGKLRLDGVASELRQKAGECFAQGRDDAAMIYRNLAKEYQQRHQEERKAYDEKYGKQP